MGFGSTGESSFSGFESVSPGECSYDILKLGCSNVRTDSDGCFLDEVESHLTYEMCALWISPGSSLSYDGAIVQRNCHVESESGSLVADCALPMTTRLPHRIIVDRDEEFWGVSSEEHGDASIAEPSVYEGYQEFIGVVEEVCAKLNDCIQDLERVSSAGSDSFSGFISVNSERSRMLRDLLQRTRSQACNIQRMMLCLSEPLDAISSDGSNPEALEASIRDFDTALVGQLDYLQPSPVAKSTPVQLTRSPIRTRAMGKVPEIPNVQPRILEYGRRKHDSC